MMIWKDTRTIQKIYKEMEVIIVKLEELVALLYEYEIVEIRMDKKKIFAAAKQSA